MADLVIGAPARRREWIIEPYLEHVMEACGQAHVEPEFVFVVPKDDPTIDLIRSRMSEPFAGGAKVDFILTDEEPAPHDKRTWGPVRMRLMVDLRNRLLRRVRQLAPLAFLSLDTDILIAPGAIQAALEGLQCYRGTDVSGKPWQYDAVGMRTYMSILGNQFPSQGQLVNNHLMNRTDWIKGTHPADVIMAAKLMGPAAYKVDYEFHTEGEDVGWSVACARFGVKLGYCADAKAKHVMRPIDLTALDERVGF